MKKVKPRFNNGDILGNYVPNPHKMLKPQYRIQILEYSNDSYKIKDIDSGNVEIIPRIYIESSILQEGTRVYTWNTTNLLTFTEGEAHGKRSEDTQAQLRPTCSGNCNDV